MNLFLGALDTTGITGGITDAITKSETILAAALGAVVVFMLYKFIKRAASKA